MLLKYKNIYNQIFNIFTRRSNKIDRIITLDDVLSYKPDIISIHVPNIWISETIIISNKEYSILVTEQKKNEKIIYIDRNDWIDYKKI
jgi:hypothetical protein